MYSAAIIIGTGSQLTSYIDNCTVIIIARMQGTDSHGLLVSHTTLSLDVRVSTSPMHYYVLLLTITIMYEEGQRKVTYIILGKCDVT